MALELVISSNRHETKVAVIEDEQLVEIHFQRANEYSLAGSIHKGRVTRVLPGMQSAFVDIGLERDAFLYVSDFVEETEEYDRIPVRTAERPAPEAEASESSERRDRRLRRGRRRRGRPHGLPESKYASAAPGSETEGLGEFAILPGESLAKYRGLMAEAETPPGERSPESQTPGEAESPVEFGCEPQVGEFNVELPHLATSEPGGEQRAQSEKTAEQEPLPLVEPFPGFTRSLTPAGEGSGPAGALDSGYGEHSQESEYFLDARAGEAAAGFPSLEHAVGEAETEEQELEEEGAEELELRSEDAEGVPLAEGGTELGARETPAGEQRTEEFVSESAVTEQAATGAPDARDEMATPLMEGEREEIEPARKPVSLTATLREQGLRYLHRPSRRLRRKMRREESEQTSRAEAEPRPESPEKPSPSIAELLREGQEVLVQIAKEPLGQKGARITSHITLPGRYVVYMPTVEHLGVSRKITSPEERLRLKKILQRSRGNMPGGFIVRTVGEGRSEEEIAADMRFLYNHWLDIRRKADKAKAPALIHHDLDLVSRVLRDEVNEDFKAIWTDNEEVYERVVGFLQRFQPSLVSRVKLYTRSEPIFDAFHVSQELEKALRPRVWLKSGGYIVINQTEALVAIDVNTGKFVGKSNRLEDTIFRTNTEAVKEIVRQIRLRDLGGIIVIDFIDMEDRKNRQRLMQALEEAMRSDRAPYKILQFNDFGLVAITRKRVKQSLERALCSPCPYCEGSGYVKSVQTIIGEILQEAHRIRGALEGRQIMLRVNPEVAKVLKSSDSNYLEELEEILGREVLVTSDPTMQQEKFDLI